MRNIFVLAVVSTVFSATAVAEENDLQVDPLLIRQAHTVWEIIASPDNTIWPGWNATDTPIMIYIPGVQEILINHPKVPDDFKKYDGPVKFGDHEIFYRNDKTLIELDGQNTSIDVFGVKTLVVADTLSNRKNNLRGILDNPTPTERKLSQMRYSSLRANPYSQMAMIAHEAFHVFQGRELNHEFANESQIKLYPCLSIKNNVGNSLEATALEECLLEKDDAIARDAAIRWLAIRKDRRADMDPRMIEYEDRNEFIEGTAKYVEVKLMEVLQGSKPEPTLWFAQGFEGFDDLSWHRENTINAMGRVMRGEVNVNNDRYGTSPVRFRLYYSGTAIALLLDRFSPNWKNDIADPSETLTSLAEKVFGATDEELEAALNKAKSGSKYEELVASKTQLAKEGAEDTKKMLGKVVDGPDLITIDYSALDTEKVGLSFTPFGVRAVDANRTIYSMTTISASMMKKQYGFKQVYPTAVLEDIENKQFQMQLDESIAVEKLAELLGQSGDGPWTVDDLAIELPGVKLNATKCQIHHNGSSLLVKFLPQN